MERKRSLEESLQDAFSRKIDSKIDKLIETLGSVHLNSVCSTPREGREPGSLCYNKAILQHVEALGRFIYHKFDDQDIITKLFIMLKLSLDTIKILFSKTREQIEAHKIRQRMLINSSSVC